MGNEKPLTIGVCDTRGALFFEHINVRKTLVKPMK